MVAPETGLLQVRRDFLANLSVSLNFESSTRFFTMTVTASPYGYDSGWSYMRSLAAAPSTCLCLFS
jgi:hypothetical protein